MKPDLSCVLNLHAEGLIAHKTVCSIERTLDYAEQHGLSTELVVVLDRATPSTAAYTAGSAMLAARANIIRTDFADLGLARNAGIERTYGKYVAVLDGDDLISENWLLEAQNVSRVDARYVVHPEVNVYFEQKRIVFYHPDQQQEDFDPANLVLANYWTSLCFARRETFLANPYSAMPPDSGFAYEDWHWNCEVMARGFIHKIAPRTAHFIREKENGGLKSERAARQALTRHSALFEPSRPLTHSEIHVCASAANKA